MRTRLEYWLRFSCSCSIVASAAAVRNASLNRASSNSRMASTEAVFVPSERAAAVTEAASAFTRT